MKRLGFYPSMQSFTKWSEKHQVLSRIFKLVPNLEEAYIAGDYRWTLTDALGAPLAPIRLSLPTGVDGCPTGVEVMYFQHGVFQSQPALLRLRANVFLANTRRLVIELDPWRDELPDIERVLHYMPMLEALEIMEGGKFTKLIPAPEIMKHLRPAKDSLKLLKVRTTRYCADFNLLRQFRQLEYLELICERRNIPKPGDHRFSTDWEGRPVLPRKLKIFNLSTVQDDKLGLDAFVRKLQKKNRHTMCNHMDPSVLEIRFNECRATDEGVELSLKGMLGS